MNILWLTAGLLVLAFLAAYQFGWLDRLMLRVAVWLTVWLALGATAAFAADTTVAALSWYQLAEPYILTAFGLVFSALLTWGLALLQRKTGLQVDQHTREVIQQAAMNAAGRVLAKQEGNVAGLRFDVHNPLVKQEIDTMQQVVPSALNRLGLTPDRIGNLILGKVGQLQAGGTIAPADPVAKQVTL